MASSIPISNIVTITPESVGTGGNPLALNAIFVDDNAYTPFTTIKSFTSLDDVGDYYGITSTQYTLASIYFTGYENAPQLPSTLYFAGYASAAKAAWLRGTSLAGVTLTTLKTYSGTLIVTIDGTVHTGTVNLSSATSFTNAATLITTAVGAGTCTWDATFSCFVITSPTTGASSTISQGTGTIASNLGLSAGTMTNGVAIDTPATCGARFKNQTNNWATWMTTFEPDLATKELCAAWNATNTMKYLGVIWDSDSGALTSDNPSCFGALCATNNYEGILPCYPNASTAAAICSWAACIDWSAINGRTTLAFRQYSAMSAVVTTNANYSALISNGYTFYGYYGGRGEDNYWSFMYNGDMSGSIFSWADTYICQVYMNSQLQLACIEGLLAVNSAPYNDLGNTFIRAWCADPITEGLNNGTIRAGVTLSSSQKATINAAVGTDISNSLFNDGYYLYIGTATTQARGNRTSPPISLYYCDGGAIQEISIDSIAVL